jgi:hypothetical protein
VPEQQKYNPSYKLSSKQFNKEGRFPGSSEEVW